MGAMTAEARRVYEAKLLLGEQVSRGASQATIDVAINTLKHATSENFWCRVAVGDGCWEWKGGRTRAGYGRLKLLDEQGRWYTLAAHRFAYEDHVGPIEVGHEIDHLCRNPPCVRPDHLEAVTPWENKRRSMAPPAINMRKAACPCGRPYTYDNAGHRICRRCIAAYKRSYSGPVRPCAACHQLLPHAAHGFCQRCYDADRNRRQLIITEVAP